MRETNNKRECQKGVSSILGGGAALKPREVKVVWTRGTYNKMPSALFWLLVRQRVDFKICLLVYKCLHRLVTLCLVSMIRSYLTSYFMWFVSFGITYRKWP